MTYQKKIPTIGGSTFFRERRGQREILLAAKIIPDVLVTVGGELVWDGVTARRADGSITYLTDDGTAQLLILAKEGQFGNLSGVILDFSRHNAIRELLDRKCAHDSRIKEWKPTPAHDPKVKSVVG